jgi:hypothetical protein
MTEMASLKLADKPVDGFENSLALLGDLRTDHAAVGPFPASSHEFQRRCCGCDLRRPASPEPSKGAVMRNDAGSVLVREDAGDFRAEEEHLGGVVHPHE